MDNKTAKLINDLLMTRYLHRGRDISKGLDCYGVILHWYQVRHGIKLLDIWKYDEEWAIRGGNHIVENYYKQWAKTVTPNIDDLIFFKNSAGIIHHAGTMINKKEFIHAFKGGVGICDISKFPLTIEGFYRYRGSINVN